MKPTAPTLFWLLMRITFPSVAAMTTVSGVKYQCQLTVEFTDIRDLESLNKLGPDFRTQPIANAKPNLSVVNAKSTETPTNLVLLVVF